jgi:hypothetical protein
VSIGTILHFPTFSFLKNIPSFETIPLTRSLQYSAMRLLIIVSSPNGASPLSRSPYISTCVTFLVLESPVQSGLLPKFGKTETWTGSDQLMDRKKPHRTDINRLSAVRVGF